MSLWYLIGSQFDAKLEAEALLTSEFTGNMQLRSVIDILHSFEEGGRKGFSSIARKWDHGGEEGLFIYRALGVSGAINVPGSGRGQTYDLTLIGIRLIANVNSASVEAFLREMNERRKVGQERRW